MKRPKALYVLRKTAYDCTYGPEARTRIADLADVCGPPLTAEAMREQPAQLLREIDVLISGWGGPVLDAGFLRATPNLRAVFYGAGSVSRLMTRAAWRRGLVVTTAQSANAIPVAEFAFAAIVFSLKQAFRMSQLLSEQRCYPDTRTIPGCFHRTVGLVSLGAAGRALLTRLRALDVHTVAYDPFVSRTEAARLPVELIGLDELFTRADVVSVHTPGLPETRGLITAAHLASMKTGAALINTARGAVIDEDALIDAASTRRDLQFILDVTASAHDGDAAAVAPPARDSLLYDLPNVWLTPHIAGSVGQECRRMGTYMADELERYVNDRPLKWRLTYRRASQSSHRPVS